MNMNLHPLFNTSARQLSHLSKLVAPLSLALLVTQPVQAQQTDTVTGFPAGGNKAPELPFVPDQTITAGEEFSLVIKPTDPDGDVPGVFAVGPRSAITFDDNGNGSRTFRWNTVRADIGTYAIQFVATDAKDQSLRTSQEVTFTIVADPLDNGEPQEPVKTAPTLDAFLPVDVLVGQTYTLVVKPTDVDGTVPGVFIRTPPANSTFDDNLNGTRTFRWTPTASQLGLNQIEFVAMDSADPGLTTESVLQIRVVENDVPPQNTPPTIAVDSAFTVQAQELIQVEITTADADGTSPQLLVENLPGDAELSRVSGNLYVLSWTPAITDAGRYDITLRAIDETDSTIITTKAISITVGDAPVDVGDTMASTTIPTQGGTLELDDIASVTFPEDAFENDNIVTVEVTTDPGVQENFNTTAAIFNPSGSLGYEITIQTGDTPPMSDTVSIDIDVPVDFLTSIPDGNQIELFAQVIDDSGLNIFEIFGADFDPQTNTLSAELPAAVFSNANSTSGEYETVITLASTPGISRPANPDDDPLDDQNGASSCQAASIQCPLSNGCTVTSPFNPAGRHPITGAASPHLGTDFLTAEGSQVLAAADGTIEFSQGSVPGYGETMVLRHSDGSATLYGQLMQRNFQVGDTVVKGDPIATPNIPGTSVASDLRLEYVPNGSIFKSKNRIDPNACIDVLATGSITVRDDGPDADDAFEIFLDGVRIGATEIGESNNFALSNLIPGNKQLAITAIVAPDNFGTMEVTLDDGITFLDGSTLLSTVLDENETEVYTINIP